MALAAILAPQPPHQLAEGAVLTGPEAGARAGQGPGLEEQLTSGDTSMTPWQGKDRGTARSPKV